MPSDKIQAQINCLPIMDLWVPGIEEGRGSGVQQKARESRRTQRDRWNQGSNRQGNLNNTRGPITTYSNDLIPSRNWKLSCLSAEVRVILLVYLLAKQCILKKDNVYTRIHNYSSCLLSSFQARCFVLYMRCVIQASLQS